MDSKPKVVKPSPVIEKVVEKDLRKVPGTPFFVDLNTGLIYLDKTILNMFK